MDHFSATGPHNNEKSLSVAPSLDLSSVFTKPADPVDRSTVWLSLSAMLLATIATGIAGVLVLLINLVTHLAFYQEWSWNEISPVHHSLGAWVILLPVLGGIIIGFMARYGSSAIRGHGIPEAMERILEHQSVIPLRITFLKPISAAISIGTGGPFGAEGPIIATGGALGSFLGQILPFHAEERKTLLAAGAAAGMTAIFGSPVAAVLLAIELLLFEYRPRSFIPVCLAAATAAGLRIAFGFTQPAFPFPAILPPTASGICFSMLLGLLMGVASAYVTKSVYALEDLFEKLPIHWMWWPAIGGVAVGIIGWWQPRTLGVGYNNIIDILAAKETLIFVGVLVFAKFCSWSIALGSGTSGGTLAPLLTIGAGGGYVVAKAISLVAPELHIDPSLAALVGMASIFAGASRALLTSIVFAFETTREPLSLLPLLAGCSSAYLVSALIMNHSIMTLRMERRGVSVPNEYRPNIYRDLRVHHVMSPNFQTFPSHTTLGACREKINQNTHSPVFDIIVTDEQGTVSAILNKGDLFNVLLADSATLADIKVSRPNSVLQSEKLKVAIDSLDRHPRESQLVVVNAERQPVGLVSFREIALVLKV